jgi:hypothetical protein
MARPLPSNRLGLRSFSHEPLEINRPFGPELKAVFSSGRKGPGGEPNGVTVAWLVAAVDQE